jgi:hypothetical protein
LACASTPRTRRRRGRQARPGGGRDPIYQRPRRVDRQRRQQPVHRLQPRTRVVAGGRPITRPGWDTPSIPLHAPGNLPPLSGLRRAKRRMRGRVRLRLLRQHAARSLESRRMTAWTQNHPLLLDERTFRCRQNQRHNRVPCQNPSHGVRAGLSAERSSAMSWRFGCRALVTAPPKCQLKACAASFGTAQGFGTAQVPQACAARNRPRQRRQRQPQAVSATPALRSSSSSFSAGVFQPSVSRGRPLRLSATWSKSTW